MSEIILPKFVLIQMLQDAAELGAQIALSKSGLLKPYLSKQDAYRLHGQSNVDRWIREGLLTPRKDGNASAKWRIDRIELEAIAKASNRHTYTMVKERG
ncbi:MAG TPA: hypothetical protein VNI52_03070 [Sphingobacteriaceae bacterium]|nr:hypothetical protein [Sphingobacteriaceae bacterium]